MTTPPKFNKNRCKSCKYHRRGVGFYVGGRAPIYCDYSGVADKTCLTIENGQKIDRRGSEYDNCLL